MAEYEMVREIQNLCGNNQMRDVFFEEVETEDPMQFVREYLRGREAELVQDVRQDGAITIYAACDGMTQRFVFTRI